MGVYSNVLLIVTELIWAGHKEIDDAKGPESARFPLSLKNQAHRESKMKGKKLTAHFRLLYTRLEQGQ